MQYRGDIDGLRAVAVLPVVFFHAGFNIFSGGYLGVDVFFVISGFLITNILISEIDQNKFTLRKFYERRARRILPALFFVLLTTSAVSFILMTPSQLNSYSQSLVSVLLFVSNFFYYFEIDYFSSAAEEMPLLHTWSLAIEEQFYLFFPPLLLVIWKLGKTVTLRLLIFIAFSSFFSMLLLHEYYNQSSSFYWPVARAWELMAGAISAILITKVKPNVSYIGNIGFIVLISALVFWPSGINHPNALLILPVLATCLIVLFPNENSFSHKILTSKFLVSIGLISYSLYLWHQPIFAFFRMKIVGHPSQQLFVIAIALSFLLAFISYKHVETPFRNRQRYDTRLILKYSAIGSLFFIVIGLMGYSLAGLPERFGDYESYATSISFSPQRDNCHSSDNKYIAPRESCTYPKEAQITWAAMGDSHIVEPAFAMSQLLGKRDMGISHHSFSGCPPALTYEPAYRKRCREWINETLEYIENNDSIKNVLLGFRYSAYLFGEHMPDYPSVPTKVNGFIANQREITDEAALELFWEDFHSIIFRLVKSNKRVWLMYPIPELPMHINKGVHPFSIFNKGTVLNLASATSMDYYLERHQYILSKLNGLREEALVVPIDVYKFLCDPNGCPAVVADKSLYFDENHLSTDGAKFLLERFFDNRQSTDEDGLTVIKVTDSN
jgi:peptidoglycan/LPS O-acetylase OafA/YrhL